MTMIDKYNQIMAIFDDEKVKHENDIIDTKIQFAKKYLQKLVNENGKLQSQLNNLNFSINESVVEENEIYDKLEQLDSMSKKDNQSSSNFFDFLNGIDDQKYAISAEIETNKKIFQSLYHQKTILMQETEALERVYKARNSYLNDLITGNRKMTDLLANIQNEADQKETEYREMILTAARLQKELRERTAPLEGYDIKLNDLRRENDEVSEELSAKQRSLKELESQIEQTEFEHQKALELRKRTKDKVTSVNTWKYNRTALGNKIKKSKEEYYSLLATLEYHKKRDARISEKLIKLLGEDETGNGLSVIAQKYVQAEINENLDSRDPRKDEEFLIEQEYNSQLQQELDMIETSFGALKKQYDRQIMSLKEELDDCSQVGYIKLLQNEMKDLLSSLAKNALK